MVVSPSRLPSLAARESALQPLSVRYLSGLWDIAQAEAQDGWEKLERLREWLTVCYQWPEWPDLWAFCYQWPEWPDLWGLAASAADHRRQEDEALHRLVMATGANDQDFLERGLRVVLGGAAVAAALGSVEQATKALPALLAAVGHRAGIPEVGGDNA